MTELYQVDARGNLRVWVIESDSEGFTITYGLKGGAMQVKRETILLGLGGRSLRGQIRSQYDSRVNKQKDKGYKTSELEAREKRGTNAMGLYKPVLAQPLLKVKNVNYQDAFVQHKYDGHRCLITKQKGKVFAYSRNGKILSSISHIVKSLDLSEGMTLDGELYSHGTPLQTITSWIKREQEATINLLYHAYDLVSPLPFKERFALLEEITQSSSTVFAVDTQGVSSEEQVKEHFLKSRKQGYEGSILRWGNEGYAYGKRSKYLVKIKRAMEDEFVVLDVLPSKDGWGILECGNEDTTFRVPAPGGICEKEKILKDKCRYIGKLITVEYANLTPDGVPFHPVAMRFREDI
jgi:DNA ligase-1